MKSFGLRMFAAVMTFAAAILEAGAQDAQKPAYLDTSLPAEQRAADLVHRMTLEEKGTQFAEPGGDSNAAPISPR